MSAALLREAADVLEAEAKAATPFGWWSDEGVSGGYVVMCPHHRIAHCDDKHGPGREDAAYIARVDPSVGLALAAWLRDVATDLDHDLWPEGHDVPRNAEAVARAILRRPS